MLSLNIKSGEYITIGDDVVVQIFRDGADARVEVKAPREMTILRGSLHERAGKKPDGLLSERPKGLAERTKNAKNMEKMMERRNLREAQRQQLLAIAGQMDRLSDTLGGTERETLKELALKLFQTVVGEETVLSK